MPKVGMEPIRRQQIRRAAAKVIARNGFRGTTIAQVAEAARVSTGMINHYYANKLAMLVDALVYVSEGFQSRAQRAVDAAEGPRAKLRAMVDCGLASRSPEERQGHRIWIMALAEALTAPALAKVIHERRRLFQGQFRAIFAEAARDGSLDEADVSQLAEECDGYVNGLAALVFVTDQLTLSPDHMERSLLALLEARRRR
jgi:TetR/AcrR family transcriptional repressor of bet genes